MSQNHPLVAINILTYNGKKYLKSCLESALNQDYSNFKIFIADNNSNDGTVECLKYFKDDKIAKIIFNSRQTGFATGHNQLIRESDGEFILCLNQDVVLNKSFLEEAIKKIIMDDKIASIQGKILRFNPDGSFSNKIDTTGLVMLKNRRVINRYQGKIDTGCFNVSNEIFGADGAVPVFRRVALEDIRINKEYFDENFFAYKEDVDLAWRLRINGWKNVYQPTAVAWHWRGSGDSATRTPWGIINERRKLNRFSKYYAFKNQRLMQIKNDSTSLILRHLPWILYKELGAWSYVLFFERYTLSAVKDLIKETPMAWRKRKIIMANRKISNKELNKWFV